MAAVWARANQIIWQEVESWTVGSVSGEICKQGKLELSWNIFVRGEKEENSAK